jgi:hypothetical protein
VAHDKLTELDAIAFLLASPSALNRALTESPKDQRAATFEQQLRDLGVSDQARIKALSALAQLSDDDLRMFRTGADKLAAMFWDGEIPHPPQPEARNVVSRMRGVLPT